MQLSNPEIPLTTMLLLLFGFLFKHKYKFKNKWRGFPLLNG